MVFVVANWIWYFQCGLSRTWLTALSLFKFPGSHFCSWVPADDELSMAQSPTEICLFLSGFTELPPSLSLLLCGCFWATFMSLCSLPLNFIASHKGERVGLNHQGHLLLFKIKPVIALELSVMIEGLYTLQPCGLSHMWPPSPSDGQWNQGVEL